MKKKSTLFYKPAPKDLPKPKRKWIVLPVLWRAVKYTCMSIGAAILISLLLGFFITSAILEETKMANTLPKQMILFYRLDGAIHEGPPKSGFDTFGPHRPSLQDIIGALEQAETDQRVKAFIMSVRSSELAISQIQELRQAVQKFRENSGKPAYIYSMSYGEAGQGLALYSLATAFDEIWLSPLGSVSVNGIRLEQPYMRGLLDKLGITPEFFQREEYKGVFENFMNKDMSEPSRESLQALTKSFGKEFIASILTLRPQVAEGNDLGGLIDKGFFLDTEAAELKLVDRVEYGDVLLDELRKKLGGNVKDKTPELVRISRYVTPAEEVHTKQHDIAVIYIQGPILVLGEGEEGTGLLGTTSNSADEIARTIVNAAEDPLVKSIVIRVDSPGGSPTASELIRRAIVRAKEKGKPVIVSMGSMAASGGYWVSAPANHIFALPGTITGSIGVAGGKASFGGLWDKIDVNWDHVGFGKNSGMYSVNSTFSESEKERINASMDRTYDMFLDVVAEGRMMKRDDVRDVAKGRVWSGAQAAENGLVDELGSLNDALDYAAKSAGYKSRKDMNVTILPKPKTALEEVLELLQKSAGIPFFLQQQAAFWSFLTTGERKQILQDAAVLHEGGDVLIYDPAPTLR